MLFCRGVLKFEVAIEDVIYKQIVNRLIIIIIIHYIPFAGICKVSHFLSVDSVNSFNFLPLNSRFKLNYLDNGSF